MSIPPLYFTFFYIYMILKALQPFKPDKKKQMCLVNRVLSGYFGVIVPPVSGQIVPLFLR